MLGSSMTREGEAERPDPLAEVSRATIEISVLEEDLDRARRLIDDNKWGEDEGLLNVFVSGLYYLLGERNLQAASPDHDSRAQEMESLVKDLMLYQSMYAVMKYRAFTLSEQKHVLEGIVAGLEAADRFASARLKTFRKDEEALKAEIERLREENEQLRKRLALETPPSEAEGNKEAGSRVWRLWKR